MMNSPSMHLQWFYQYQYHCFYNQQRDNDNDRRVHVVPLRHGETLTIFRKVAMKQALSFRLGWFESRFSGSRRRMEEARRTVLQTSRFDAPLSEKEKGEAAAARKLIQELTCGTNRCMSRFRRQCRKASVTAGSICKALVGPFAN
jgi:hypothetical protein